MAAGLMIGQLAGFQKLDEMRPGNTQKIRGALRRQLLVFGDQDNRPANCMLRTMSLSSRKTTRGSSSRSHRPRPERATQAEASD